MAEQTIITPSDLYAQIVDRVTADPAMEAALLADFNGTVAARFGVTLPTAGRLSRNESGFRLSYDGQDYDLGDPRNAKPGELNDAELELVSGGFDLNPCPKNKNQERASEGRPPVFDIQRNDRGPGD